MPHSASLKLRWLYCLAIVSAIFPLGVSGWVTMSLGVSTLGTVPFLGPLVLLLIGLVRIYQVATDAERLDAYEVSGLLRLLRVAGIVGMSLGVLYVILQLGYRPLVSKLFIHRSESGVEFYVVGMYIALLSGMGSLGVLLFEASRLFGFETRLKNG
jgi:hypothetical protein